MLEWYYVLLVKRPFLVVIGIGVLCTACIIVSLTAKDFPDDFTDPTLVSGYMHFILFTQGQGDLDRSLPGKQSYFTLNLRTSLYTLQQVVVFYFYI